MEESRCRSLDYASLRSDRRFFRGGENRNAGVRKPFWLSKIGTSYFVATPQGSRKRGQKTEAKTCTAKSTGLKALADGHLKVAATKHKNPQVCVLRYTSSAIFCSSSDCLNGRPWILFRPMAFTKNFARRTQSSWPMFSSGTSTVL